MSGAQYSLVLPHELIVEILSQLSVKDLMHFRCVRKSWKSIIFDPTLVKLHLERSSKEPYIILTIEDVTHKPNFEGVNTRAIPYSKINLFDDPSSTIDEDGCYQLKTNYEVVGSCNGLVCLDGFYVEEEIEEYIRFWNPATRMRSKKSPFLRVDPCCSRFITLAFNKFGFGYDESSDTYKVLSVLSDCRSEKTEVRVHCLGDNCWRKILSCPNFPILTQFGQLVSGTINWLALDMLSSHYQWETITLNQLVIFSFDLQNETYRYLLLPNGLGEVPEDEPTLTILGDRLCLFYDHQGTHFVVWEMREFGLENSWNQLVNVSYEHLDSKSYLRPMLPLCMFENEDVLLLVNNDDLEVILYDYENNTVELITEIPDNKVWWKADSYFQSLVSPSQDEAPLQLLL